MAKPSRRFRSSRPSSDEAASAAVACQVGVGHASVRRWVLQADFDDGSRDVVASAEHVGLSVRGCVYDSGRVGRAVDPTQFPPGTGVRRTAMRTYKVGYFVGSLSSTSINRVLSKALIRLAPPNLEFTELPIRNLPLYSPDFDRRLYFWVGSDKPHALPSAHP